MLRMISTTAALAAGGSIAPGSQGAIRSVDEAKAYANIGEGGIEFRRQAEIKPTCLQGRPATVA